MKTISRKGAWHIYQYDGDATIYADNEDAGAGRIDIEVDADQEWLTIEWDERSDDFRGYTTRRVSVPVDVILAMLDPGSEEDR